MKKIRLAFKLFGYAVLSTIGTVGGLWLLMEYFKLIEFFIGSVENTILIIEIFYVLLISCIISYIIFGEDNAVRHTNSN